MPNVIIPHWHQSAPEAKYDPLLAREAAAAKDRVKAGRKDWDRIDWEATNPVLRRRREMVNQDFDREFERPEFHDPALQVLEQRAYIEKIERRPEEWVEEGLALHEANCEKARDQHLPEQERWQNERSRLVRIMHPSTVMRKLQRAGVDARDQESPRARIWLNDWSAAGLVGVNAWIAPQPMDEEGYLLALSTATAQQQKDLITANWMACRAGRKVQRTLTSLQEPYGPEWSVMRFNSHGVATKEKYRGWRTAMLVLIVADILTEAEVEAAFGPAEGEAAVWYKKQLQAWREIKLGLRV